eukprot:550464-Amphidinium_carterae.1
MSILLLVAGLRTGSLQSLQKPYVFACDDDCAPPSNPASVAASVEAHTFRTTHGHGRRKTKYTHRPDPRPFGLKGVAKILEQPLSPAKFDYSTCVEAVYACLFTVPCRMH